MGRVVIRDASSVGVGNGGSESYSCLCYFILLPAAKQSDISYLGVAACELPFFFSYIFTPEHVLCSEKGQN